MELKLENKNNKSATFYDLDLEIADQVFHSKLYDKRDAFTFSVVRMPYKCSSMPYKMFYATISAEILRICRATSEYKYFLDSVQKLIIRMRKQGAKSLGIRRIVTKMMGRHGSNFHKFRIPAEVIALDVSSF